MGGFLFRFALKSGFNLSAEVLTKQQKVIYHQPLTV